MYRTVFSPMLGNMSGINSSTALWYASRATGVVALLLMTGVVLLGLLVTRQGRLPGLPRFAVTGLHRNLSLVAVVFVALHVLTAVMDSYVKIPLIAAVVPLSSSYEQLAIGLGAASVDITIAVIVTSLLRRHLSRRLWRAVHLLAYLSWPVAWLHSITASRDMLHSRLSLIAIGCALLVVIAVGWRLAAASRDVPRAQRVGLLMSAVHDRAPLRHKHSEGERMSGHGAPYAGHRGTTTRTEPLAGQGRTSRR
jgi:methionine sulfoxide reductase heme-binding subunit